jgi:phospholipid/cholesterol/gamma-HCH transport system permease protein
MLKRAFSASDNKKIYRQEIFKQFVNIGNDSLAIVTIVSVFMGGVFTVQTAYQLVSSLVSRSIIGTVVSDSTILELSPSITALVLAGKIGSSIASEIGTMKVTEQVDAIEVMGINSANYLIAPKIIASIIAIPMLNILGMALCIGGGTFVANFTGIVTADQFIQGARESFLPYNIVFSLTKSFTFGFLISSVSAYQGYYTSGGALEVGKSSTNAVVYSCICILIADYTLTQLLLT